MFSDNDLKKELESEFSYVEILKIAKDRGLEQHLETKEDLVEWLLQNGLTWREYALNYNAYFSLKLKICKFFGIKKGWRVLDLGCGSGGTSIAAASLVGNNGKVLAIDPLEEYVKKATDLAKKTMFEDAIEIKRANVLDLEFDKGSFDIVLLLYTPQFLGYIQDFREVLFKIREWTKRVGIADHIPMPKNYAESVYLLYSWLSCDAARDGSGKKTDRLYHITEISTTLKNANWRIMKEKIFPVSAKNTYPAWAMDENLKRLKKQIETIKDPIIKEVYETRLLTIESFTDEKMFPNPPSIFAVLARKH